MPTPPLELQGALQALSGSNLSAQGAANLLVDAVALAAGTAVKKPTSPTTFTQTYSTTATAVPAAPNVGTLVLLSDVITAVGLLQTAANDNRKLLNAIIDILQAAGLAS